MSTQDTPTVPRLISIHTVGGRFEEPTAAQGTFIVVPPEDWVFNWTGYWVTENALEHAGWVIISGLQDHEAGVVKVAGATATIPDGHRCLVPAPGIWPFDTPERVKSGEIDTAGWRDIFDRPAEHLAWSHPDLDDFRAMRQNEAFVTLGLTREDLIGAPY